MYLSAACRSKRYIKRFSLFTFFICSLFTHAIAEDDAIVLADAASSAQGSSDVGVAFDVRSGNSIRWLPWEGWDPLTGKISHHMVDIEYHGNTGMPIILSRTYRNSVLASGQVGYGIDVPTLHHNNHEIGNSNNCYNYLPFENIDSSYTYFGRASGMYFVYGRTQIHFFDYAQSVNSGRFPSDALLVSPDNWYITCENNNLHVHSSDGMTFKMSAKNGNAVMLASTVSDRFDNTLTYDYTYIYPSNSAPLRRLTKISANDGRELTFTNPTGNKIGEIYVTSNGSPNPHRIDYYYESGKLQVKRNDGQTTRYQYDSAGRILGIRVPTQGLVNYTYHPGTNELKDRKVTNQVSGVDHDNTYYFTKQDHGDELSWTVTTPLVKHLYTVRKSKIDKNNIAELSGPIHEAQGKLVRVEQFKNDGQPLEQSTPHLKVDYVYEKDNSLADVVSLVNNYADPNNYPKSWISLFHAWKSRVKTTTSTMWLGNGNPITATRTVNSRDEFGRPKVIVESGTAGSRTMTLSYEDLTTRWITGLLKERKLAKSNNLNDVIDTLSFTYDGWGRVQYRYDNAVRLEYLYVSNSSPLLKETKDGRSRRFTYDDYYRGIARKEGRRGKDNDWEYKYRVVNSDGTIESESRWSDEFATWEYEYDTMRRVNKITSPRAQTAQVDITWHSPNYVKTTQSNLESESRYDGFGRVIFEGSKDTDTGTSINHVYRYDKHGRLEFQSIPVSNSFTDYASVTKGTRYRYDNFDRMTRSINSGGIGTLNYSYDLSGASNVKVTDGEGRTSTTYYNYYGDFNSAIINKITDGNGIDTVLSYDVAGKITQSARDGLTRSYQYNDKALLRRESHPETGNTYYWYGNNGLLTWTGNQSSLGNSTEKTNYKYDLSNRISKIRYGGGSLSHYVDQSFFYDANGNLEKVTSDGAVAGNDDWISTEYTYDEEENLLSETFKVDNQTFVLDYLYDDLSGLRQRKYPSGNLYNYAPDAFGRATHIVSGNGKEILSDIQYHPDGQASTVENPGGTYSRTRLSFGYPSAVKTTLNNQSLGYRYRYDKSGNIHKREYIGTSGEENFSYDNNHRLTDASGPRIGQWSFVYDNRENILNYTQDGVTRWFEYDGSNRLSKANNKNVTYDARRNINNDGTLWSGFNRANQIYQDGHGHTYGYDGHGRRIIEQFSDMTDYTIYDRQGVLRYRYGKKYDVKSEYHTVNGQLFARRDIDSGGGGGPGPCIDTDGDGWGWDGEKTCIP